MIVRAVVALALIAGCHKKAPQANSGSAEGSSAGSGSAVAATSPPAKDVGKALDDALAAKHIAPDAVKKRTAAAGSAWAVVGGKVNDLKELLGVDVIASRADGIAELHLEPPAGTSPATISQIESLDAKDLDGNGTDEGILVVDWSRTTTIPGEQKGWEVSTDEEVRQLYVLGGAAPALRVAFTHAISYQTHSEGVPEENATPYPADEQVTYDWTVTPGKPPVARLTRTKSDVAAKDRLKGALDPASDPMFAAGSGKDMPIDKL